MIREWILRWLNTETKVERGQRFASQEDLRRLEGGYTWLRDFHQAQHTERDKRIDELERGLKTLKQQFYLSWEMRTDAKLAEKGIGTKRTQKAKG